MPFDWPEYLNLADELSKRTTEEACLRTAMSRAYYFVYHLARQRLIDNGFIFVIGDSHKQVWEKFGGDPDYRCRQLKDIGKILHDKRKQADYDNPYGRIEDEFPAVLEKAKKFANDLKALDKRLPVNRGVSSRT